MMQISAKRLRFIIKEELAHSILEYQVGDGASDFEPADKLPSHSGTKTDIGAKMTTDYRSAPGEKQKSNPVSAIENILTRAEHGLGSEGQPRPISDYHKYRTAKNQGDVDNQTYTAKDEVTAEKIWFDDNFQKLVKAARQRGVTVSNDGCDFTIKYPTSSVRRALKK